MGTVNRKRYTQMATKHINKITAEVNEKLGQNREQYSKITESKWGVEDIKLEHRYAEKHMDEVIRAARIREDPKMADENLLLGKFQELRIKDQYDANAYMCMACDKGWFCPKHKLRPMHNVLKGTISKGTVAFQTVIDKGMKWDREALEVVQKEGSVATDIFYLNH